MTRPRKLTLASKDKIVREFGLEKKVEAVLRELGATPRAENATGFARCREWTVSTKVGLLGVSPYDDWIACVFEAPNYLTSDNCKWNHHSFATTRVAYNRDHVRDALQRTLDQFAWELRRLRT